MVDINKVLSSAKWVEVLERDVENAIRNNESMTPDQLTKRILIKVYDWLDKSDANIEIV